MTLGRCFLPSGVILPKGTMADLSQMMLESPSNPGLVGCHDSKPLALPTTTATAPRERARWQEAGVGVERGAGLPLTPHGASPHYACFCFALFDGGHGFQERKERRKS